MVDFIALHTTEVPCSVNSSLLSQLPKFQVFLHLEMINLLMIKMIQWVCLVKSARLLNDLQKRMILDDPKTLSNKAVGK